MSTCAVNVSLVDLGLEPVAGVVSFTPIPETVGRSGNALVAPAIIELALSEGGTGVVDLLPGLYSVTAASVGGWQRHPSFIVTVPAATLAYLAQLVQLPPPPTLDAAEQAVLDAQTARDVANLAAFDADADRIAAQTARTAAEVAMGAAEASEDAAAASAAAASSSAAAAASSASGAASDRTATAADRTQTGLDRTATAASVIAADAYEAAAGASASESSASAAASQASRLSSEAARDSSIAAKTSSESARDAAQTARTGSETAKTAAEAAQAASQAAKTASETARDAAQTSAGQAATFATAAQGSATAAAGSASGAATSATAAQTARTGAETANTAAQTAKTAAEVANASAQEAANVHEAVAGNVGTLMAAFGQAYEELAKVVTAQDDSALNTVAVLNLAMILGQIADQVNGGRVALAGATLADPAIRIGTVGIYSAAANTLSVAIAGVERLRVTASGITVYGTVTTA